MARISWSKPVTVETRKTGQRLSIGSVERAREFLLNEWPTLEDGKAYREAKGALTEACEGNLEAEKAREAFLAALKEGEVFVFEE